MEGMFWFDGDTPLPPLRPPAGEALRPLADVGEGIASATNAQWLVRPVCQKPLS